MTQNTHQFQPVTDRLTGKTVVQCTRCGHRWFGKGEPKAQCIEPEVMSGATSFADEMERNKT